MSQQWAWVARAQAYDIFLDRKKREAELAEIVEMRRRHTQMAMSFQGAAALALNKIIAAEKATVKRKLENGREIEEPAPLTLKPSEVKDLAELGMKIERLNRGEPEAIVEQQISTPESRAKAIVHDYSNLNLEELKALRALTQKARTRGKAEKRKG